ncbi:hypothetical protein [Actinoplanes sp. NPDC051859]|uniref:hypothetical protein n=1 Tax=Actinoplanes sp. NPDC051859 TaxID=3363909 RepID=UPI00378821CF
MAKEPEQRDAPAAAPEVPLLQVLVVEDDFGDLALVENAFDEHSIPSELHHCG